MRALEISPLCKNIYIFLCVDILCGIWKATIEIPHKKIGHSYTEIWGFVQSWNFKACYIWTFIKRPPGPCIIYMYDIYVQAGAD